MHRNTLLPRFLMASGARSRPSSFQSGKTLSDYYKVECLVRVAEGRMYYLVNDDRRDRPTRRCWECGEESNLQAATQCSSCGFPLATRRFLVSSRWERSSFEPFFSFFNKQITHPAILTPCDVFPFPEDVPNQICSVVPYQGETFLLDEASPLPIDRVLHLAQRALGTLVQLARSGVMLNSLQRSQFLVRPDGELVLYDFDVGTVQDEPYAPEDLSALLMDLGGLLRRYTAPEEQGWHDFFHRVEKGIYETPAELGREMMAFRHQAPQRLSASTHAGMTDVGLQRPLNEDNWGWGTLAEGVDLFVVADGMGGHECGEVASKLAVETLISVARKRMEVQPRPSLDAIENILDEAFQEANNTIKANAESRGNDMGTTTVACLVIDNQIALCANVGDSRGYLIRGGALHQVTRDHSLVARMVEQGRLRPEEARNHPHSNILLRTVGTERNVDIDIFRVELEPGDRLLLCSDGLWGEVEDSEMQALLNQHADTRACTRELIRAAHLGGGKDNISVVLVSVPG